MEDKKENIDNILSDCKKLLKICNELDAEMDSMKEGVDFLLNEYKTNKRWFREEPGRVTIEDVIKTSFEFGWASKRTYDQNNE